MMKRPLPEVMTVQLDTPRLSIRPFRPGDLADLQEILGDSDTMAHLEPAYTPDQTRQFLADFCIQKGGALAAVLKETQKVIGYILFSPLEEGVYELGWVFHRAYWRRGCAYESCSAVLAWGFRELGVHKVVAETIDPVKSVPLMEKLGMSPDGPPQGDPPLYCYALSRP